MYWISCAKQCVARSRICTSWSLILPRSGTTSSTAYGTTSAPILSTIPAQELIEVFRVMSRGFGFTRVVWNGKIAAEQPGHSGGQQQQVVAWKSLLLSSTNAATSSRTAARLPRTVTRAVVLKIEVWERTLKIPAISNYTIILNYSCYARDRLSFVRAMPQAAHRKYLSKNTDNQVKFLWKVREHVPAQKSVGVPAPPHLGGRASTI